MQAGKMLLCMTNSGVSYHCSLWTALPKDNWDLIH